MKDCRKRAAGKPKTAQSPRLPNQKSRAKAEEAKARRERPSMNGQMNKRDNRLVTNQVRKLQVCSLVLLTNMASTTDVKGTTDVKNTTKVTGKSGNESRSRRYNSGNLLKLETCV